MIIGFLFGGSPEIHGWFQTASDRRRDRWTLSGDRFGRQDGEIGKRVFSIGLTIAAFRRRLQLRRFLVRFAMLRQWAGFPAGARAGGLAVDKSRPQWAY